MTARHRLIASLVSLAAVAAWFGVAMLFMTVSPVGDANVRFLGALLLGAAVALTAWPIAWRLATSRRDEGPRDEWLASGRRAALIGLAVAVLVMLRAMDAFSLPVAIFVVVVAVLVELAFTLRR